MTSVLPRHVLTPIRGPRSANTQKVTYDSFNAAPQILPPDSDADGGIFLLAATQAALDKDKDKYAQKHKDKGEDGNKHAEKHKDKGKDKYAEKHKDKIE